MADHEYTLKFKVEGQDDIDKAKNSIDELSDKQVNVTVETDDKDLDETKDKLDELGDSDTTAEVKVEADTTQADETIEVLGEIDATDVTANAEVSSDTTGAEEVVTAIEEVDGSEGTGEANTKSDLTGVDEAEQGLSNFDGSTATGEANVDSDISDLENGVSRSKGMLGNLTNGKYIVDIEADTKKVDSTLNTIEQKMVNILQMKISGGISEEYSTIFKDMSKFNEEITLTYADMYDSINKGGLKIDSAMKKGLDEAFNTNKVTRIKEFGSSINSTVSSTFQGIVSNASKGNIGGVLKSISTGFTNIGTSAQNIYGASSTVAKLTTSVGALAGKFAMVGTAIATATKFLTPFAQEGKKIAGLSDQLGMTAEAFQEMSIIGEKFGVSSDVMSSAVQRMFKNIENESPKAVASIEQLGISFDQFKNMSTEEQLKAVGEGLSKVTDASKRSAIAQNIFGASGKKMIKTCIEMAGASDNVADSLAGQIAYTEEGTERSKGFMNALTEMKNRFKALITPIATAVMPAFQGLFDFISGAIAIVKPILDPFITLIGEIGQIAGNVFGGLGQILATVGDAFTVWEQKISNSKVIKALTGIGEAVGDLFSKANEDIGESASRSIGNVSTATGKAKDKQEAYNDALDEADYSSVEDGTDTIEEQAQQWIENTELFEKYQGIINNPSMGYVDSWKESIDEAFDTLMLEGKFDDVAELLRTGSSDIQKEMEELVEKGTITPEQGKAMWAWAKKYLQDWDKELEEKSGKNYKIGYLEYDISKLEEILKKAQAYTNDDANHPKIEVEVTANTESFEHKMGLVQTLKAYDKEVTISANDSAFTKTVKKWHNFKVKTKASIDQSQFMANLNEMKSWVNKWTSEEGKKKIGATLTNAWNNVKSTVNNWVIKPVSKKINTVLQGFESIKNRLSDWASKALNKFVNLGIGGTGTKKEAVATKRPQRFGTPTTVEVGEYQEEVILGTNIYEQALKNAMGSGVEQGAMMTANNLGNVTNAVDTSMLHTDLQAILTKLGTLNTGSTNQVVNVVNGGKVSTNNVGSKTSLISETLRNVGNKNAGITSHDKMVIEALLREIL